MKRSPAILALAVVALAAPRAATAQSANPYEGNPGAIRVGRALYENRCAECHGADAKGMNGPDLTVLWAQGTSDERVLQTIRNGVRGSIMPAFDSPENELWAMVAYLRSVSTVSPFETASGDAGGGRELFAGRCARCHRVQGEGGSMGPELTLIARVRTRAALERSIRDPAAAVAPGYRPVTVVTAAGERVRGAVKGEDAFSLQLADVGGRLQGYRKADLQEVVRDPGSLMPAFGEDRLSAAELDDLLAYLGTLR